LGAGDIWTGTAICADTKLVPCWAVGARDSEYALALLDNLRQRLANRVQLTSDGHKPLRDAGEALRLGRRWPGALSAAEVQPRPLTGTREIAVTGNPDPAHVSTSFAERQNLTMRMSVRRFKRLTNAFSKKGANHEAAVALHFMHHKFRAHPPDAAGFASDGGRRGGSAVVGRGYRGTLRLVLELQYSRNCANLLSILIEQYSILTYRDGSLIPWYLNHFVVNLG
jgi:hypothetical protein